MVKMDLGIEGLGMACSLSNFIIYLGNLVYPLLITEIKPALFWPSR